MPQDNQDYYDDSPAAAAPAEAAKPDTEEGGKKGESFIVPKSAFGGREIKPGDKCDIEVKAVHEDSVECLPCEGHDEHDENPPEEPPAEPQAGPMGGMME